jgi:hypothetical protein
MYSRTASRYYLAAFEHSVRPNLPVHFERAINPPSFEFDLKEGATPDGAQTPPSA